MGWAALVVPVLALAACTSPATTEEADVPATAVVSAEAPAALDPAAAGLEVADTSALGALPDLVTQVQQCGVADAEVDPAAVAPFEVVTAGRQVLGVHCLADDGGRTLYADVADGSVWSAQDLLTQEGQAEVSQALAAARADGGTQAGGDAAGDPAAEVSVTAGSLADLRFDEAGNLIMIEGNGAAWKVDAGEVDSLLSERGRLVRGAVRSGGEFRGITVGNSAQAHVVNAALLPPPAAPIAPPAPPAGSVDCAVAKCIALTFDDGPGPETPRLLQILADKDVPATFFMVGKNAQARPETVKAVLDAGHELGDHTWNHPDLRTVSAEQVRKEVSDTSAAIAAGAGQGPTVMRPPYGATNDTVLSVLKDLGLPVVMWSVDTEDWKNKSTSETRARAVAGAHPGAIILQHDIHSWSIDAVPGIIDDLRAQGYSFVTVSQLFDTMNPGEKYFSRG